MATSLYSRLRQIDEAVSKGPSLAALDQLVLPVLLEFASREYFLDSLADPDWLEPLCERGFFDQPPSPMQHGDLMAYPAWPEVRYLARVSQLASTTVEKIIAKMPETENIWVIDDILKTINRLPVDVARELVPRVIGWLPKLRGMPGAKDVAKLASRLAEGGQGDSALELYSALLQVRVSDHRGIFGRAQVESVIDGYAFENAVSEHLPVLMKHLGESALIMCCNLLDEAISIEASDDQLESGEDFSYIWCQTVEGAGGPGSDVTSMLVVAVRDAAIQLTKERKISIGRIWEILATKRWSIFNRIFLHVLGVADDTRSIVADVLLKEAAFREADELEHEYKLLLEAKFATLNEAAQHQVLNWIKSGPNLPAGFQERYSSWLGRQATPHDILQYADDWRAKRLHIIRDCLRGDWLQRYLSLKEAYLDRHETPQTSLPTRPSEEELAAMELPQLVAYLSGWERKQQPGRDDYEWIGQVLTRMVIGAPERFAPHAELFANLTRPIYTNAILHGLSTAQENDRRFSWQHVLALCKFIQNNPQPSTLNRWSGGEMIAEPIDSERYAIALLMEKAFRRKNGPEYALRNDAWSVIESLIVDAGESPDAPDQSYMSLNSTRSMAIESAIYYASWVKENAEANGKEVAGGFDLAPEVRSTLYTLLGQTENARSDLHLVLGKTLPWLATMDQRWCKDNLRRILPHGKCGQDQRRAAWNTYLKYHQPHPVMLRLLRREFRYAVNMLDTPSSTQGPFGDSAEDLAQHLMIYYWWGNINLRPNNSLVKQFFRMASEKQRTSAIKFIGWSFWRTEEQAPHDVIARLVELWDWRMSIIGSHANVDEFREELAEFGWWVRSNKFPREWSLTNIHEIIRMIGWFPMVDEVLAVLIGDDAELAMLMECLESILDSASELERWKLIPLVKPAQAILGKALEDSQTRKRALELANEFGAKGFIKEFRDLAGRYGSHQ